MFISGFEGIGNDIICRNYPMWVHLTVEPFSEDMEVYDQIAMADYLRTALSLDDHGFNVIVDDNPEFRKFLLKNHVPYYFVAPDRGQKEDYARRYQDSGIPKKRLDALLESWDERVKAQNNELVIRLAPEESIFDVNWNLVIPELPKDELNEDVAGMSASFASLAPENCMGTVTLGSHIEDLENMPRKLNEFFSIDINDICFD